MVDIGDLAKYYRRRRCHDATMTTHPVLYTWQTDEQICISEADAELKSVADSVSEYDVSDIQFEYPVYLYGYPEIYGPSDLSIHARSYMHRLFNLDADVWIRCEEKEWSSGL